MIDIEDKDTTDMFEDIEEIEVSFPADPDEFVVWLSHIIGEGYIDTEIDSVDLMESVNFLTSAFLQSNDELTMPSLEVH
tara:strand:+ start:934 stop:1170 length:237 start_codon:yes stop_codon:yes gene_type:complete